LLEWRLRDAAEVEITYRSLHAIESQGPASCLQSTLTVCIRRVPMAVPREHLLIRSSVFILVQVDRSRRAHDTLPVFPEAPSSCRLLPLRFPERTKGKRS